jgi:hypothetical protein
LANVVFLSDQIHDAERNAFAILLILFIVIALATSLAQAMKQIIGALITPTKILSTGSELYIVSSPAPTHSD